MYFTSNPGANAETFEDVFWNGETYCFGEIGKRKITSWRITVGNDATGRLDYLDGQNAEECWMHTAPNGKVQMDLDKVVKQIYNEPDLPHALAFVEEMGGTYINVLVHITYKEGAAEGGGAESGGGEPVQNAAPPEAMVEIENTGKFDLKWGRLEVPARETITVPKSQMAALASESLAVANPTWERPAEAYRYASKRIPATPLEPERKERYEISAEELDSPTVVVRNEGEVAIEIDGKTIPPGGTGSVRTTSNSSTWWFQFAAKPGDEERKFFDWAGGEISGEWPGWGGVTNVSVRAKKTERRVAPPKLVPVPGKGTEGEPLQAEPSPRPKPKPESAKPLPPKAKPAPPVIEAEEPEPLPEIVPPLPEPEIPLPVVPEKPGKQQTEVVRKPMNPEEAKEKINRDWPGLEEWEEGDLPSLSRMSKGMADLKGSGVQGGGLPDWDDMKDALSACDNYAREKKTDNNTAQEILKIMDGCRDWDEFLGR